MSKHVVWMDASNPFFQPYVDTDGHWYGEDPIKSEKAVIFSTDSDILVLEGTVVQLRKALLTALAKL